MQELQSPAQEAAEDIYFGQVVIVWARWFVILAGTILALWSASSVSDLTRAVLLIGLLMAINFLAHGRFLMDRPANRGLLIVMSLFDLLIITVIVLAWMGQNGLESPFFIFYYPMILAFAFVFPPFVTAVYVLVAMVAYVGAVFITDPSFVGNSIEIENLVQRLITLAAMGGLATFHWRIQRDRRRGISELPTELSPAAPRGQ